ncbi:restriction endonuclease subunit S [Streptomyces sp. SM1]|uniref:restriction endonuclease subunit S n=1 Tax=Streptomyces sp. SM1 TaxID=402229 RepID=UPI0011B0D697|nr:restriction endonuclease subunit S [Streptomyces sp. SM1]
MAPLEDLLAVEPRAITDGPFGSNLKSAHYTDSGARVLRLQNVGDGEFRDERAYINLEHFETLRAHEALPGDFLLASLGETLPRVAIVPKMTEPAIVKADVIRARLHPTLNDKWVLYALLAPQTRAYASSRTRGVGRPRLGLGEIRRLPIPVPPLGEQERIVEALEALLSRLDAADELLQKSSFRVARLKRSVADITLGFHGGDFSETASLPPISGSIDGSLPSLPREWSWRRLGEIADVVGGVTKDSKKQQDPSLPEVPYLRVANVQRGHLDLENVMRIRVPQSKLDQLRLLPGDVLMNEGGDRDKLGRGWVWGDVMDDVIHQNHVFRARIKDQVLLPKLLSWWTNNMGRWFERNGKQSTNLASISLKKIKELPVPVPPADVQLEILRRIEEQSLIAAKAEEALHLAQRRSTILRKVLLRKAFSGCLVPQNPDEEPAAVLLDRIRVERAAQPKPKRTRAGKAPAARKAAATVPAPEPTETPRTATQQELPL